MTVFVRAMMTFAMRLPLVMTSESLRAVVADRLAVPGSSFSLLLNGRPLRDGFSLADLGAYACCTIDLIPRLIGGMESTTTTAHSVELADGSVYNGEVDGGGRPHGKGVADRANCKMTGKWVSGHFSVGSCQWECGATYVGPWDSGKPHGKGTLVKQSTRLQCDWDHGVPKLTVIAALNSELLTVLCDCQFLRYVFHFDSEDCG